MTDFMDALSETVQDTSDSLGSHLHGFGDFAEIYSAGQARQQTQALGALALQQQQLIQSEAQAIELSRKDLGIQKDQLSQLKQNSEYLRHLLSHLDALERRRELEYERDAKCPACHTRLSSTPDVCPCCSNNLQWESFNEDTEGIIWGDFVQRIKEHARNADFTVLNLEDKLAVPLLSADTHSPIRDHIAHVLYNSQHHYKLVNEKASKQRLEDELNLYWLQHQLNSHDCLCECCGYLFSEPNTHTANTCSGCQTFVESAFSAKSTFEKQKKLPVKKLSYAKLKKTGQFKYDVTKVKATTSKGIFLSLMVVLLAAVLSRPEGSDVMIATISVTGVVTSFFCFFLRSRAIEKLLTKLDPILEQEAADTKLKEYTDLIEELTKERRAWIITNGSKFRSVRPFTWFPNDISGLPNEPWVLNPNEFGDAREMYMSPDVWSESAQNDE